MRPQYNSIHSIPVMAKILVPIYENVHPLVWRPAAWVWEGYLRSWQMNVPDGSND